MRKDEINEPLGLEADAQPGRRSARFWIWAICAGCAIVAIAAEASYLARGTGQDAGVSAEIAQPAKVAASAPSAPAANASLNHGPSASAAAGDVENGVRVIRGGDPAASMGALIRVPTASGAASSDGLSPAPDPRLVENGRFGPLPKIGANGARPFNVYRRQLGADAGLPKIALVITGMGLNADLTREAATQLPPETTFAFAPIAANLWDQVASAREAGHETLLQAPMEALATDGGVWPHELTTEAGVARNIENLRWSMSRFPGYFGVMNFLGAKLMSDRAVITPILQELAGRGLAFVDDGTSAQSLAPTIAAALQMPSVRADATIDAGGTSDDADAALARLKALAQARGWALGVAAGLPVTIERLERFTNELSSAGFELVPVSALASASPSLATSAK